MSIYSYELVKAEEMYVPQQDVLQSDEGGVSEGLGADVSEFVSRGHQTEFHHPFSAAFFEMTHANGDVFLLLAELRNFAHGYGSAVIDVKRRG